MDRANLEGVKRQLSSYVLSMFNVNVNQPYGKRGREWAWRWGYWGRAISVLFFKTKDPAFLELLVFAHQNLMKYRDDSLGLTDDIRGGIKKSWGTCLSGIHDKGLRACEAETTGLMLLPFTDFLIRNRDHHGLVAKGIAESFLSTVIEGLEVHLDEFRFDPRSDGVYLLSPWTSGVEPLNHTHLYAAVIAETFAVTGQQRYKNLALRAYKYFRSHWHLEANGTVSWSYAPTPTNSNIDHVPLASGERGFSQTKGAELFYKSCVTIELPVALHRTGLLNSDEVALIARSLVSNVFRKDWSLNIYISPRKIQSDASALLVGRPILRPAYVCALELCGPCFPEASEIVRGFIKNRSDFFPKGFRAGTAQFLAWALQYRPSEG